MEQKKITDEKIINKNIRWLLKTYGFEGVTLEDATLDIGYLFPAPLDSIWYMSLTFKSERVEFNRELIKAHGYECYPHKGTYYIFKDEKDAETACQKYWDAVHDENGKQTVTKAEFRQNYDRCKRVFKG